MLHKILELIVTYYTRLTRPVPQLPLTAKTADISLAVLRHAVSQIGFGERGSNNAGMYVERYAASVDKQTPLVWCAAFVYYCYSKAVKEIGAAKYSVNPSAGAKALCRNIIKAGGRKLEVGEYPMPGDVALWHRGAKNAWTGHVGVVQGTNVGNGTFTVVEGNRGAFPANVAIFGHSMGEAGLLGFYRFPRHEVTATEVIA